MLLVINDLTFVTIFIERGVKWAVIGHQSPRFRRNGLPDPFPLF